MDTRATSWDCVPAIGAFELVLGAHSPLVTAAVARVSRLGTGSLWSLARAPARSLPEIGDAPHACHRYATLDHWSTGRRRDQAHRPAGPGGRLTLAKIVGWLSPARRRAPGSPGPVPSSSPPATPIGTGSAGRSRRSSSLRGSSVCSPTTPRCTTGSSRARDTAGTGRPSSKARWQDTRGPADGARAAARRPRPGRRPQCQRRRPLKMKPASLIAKQGGVRCGRPRPGASQTVRYRCSSSCTASNPGQRSVNASAQIPPEARGRRGSSGLCGAWLPRGGRQIRSHRPQNRPRPTPPRRDPLLWSAGQGTAARAPQCRAPSRQ